VAGSAATYPQRRNSAETDPVHEARRICAQPDIRKDYDNGDHQYVLPGAGILTTFGDGLNNTRSPTEQ
jgi:hypothetical protein